jgi:hypothetical protein
MMWTKRKGSRRRRRREGSERNTRTTERIRRIT